MVRSGSLGAGLVWLVNLASRWNKHIKYCGRNGMLVVTAGIPDLAVFFQFQFRLFSSGANLFRLELSPADFVRGVNQLCVRFILFCLRSAGNSWCVIFVYNIGIHYARFLSNITPSECVVMVPGPRGVFP